MKRVKMIVSAVVVFAVVGSSLAFKAFNPKNIYCNDANGKCTLLVNFTNVNTGSGATTNPCNESTATKHYSTTQDINNPCPSATFTVYTPDLF